MIRLAIDTSASLCAVAVFDEQANSILASQTLDIGRGHAEVLISLVNDVMGQAETSFSGLSSITVTIGPGSFTGVRVGLAAARGFGLSLSVPVNGISTLDACTKFAQATSGIKNITTLIDAKRGEAYFKPVDGDAVMYGYETLRDKIESEAVLAGSGAPIFNEVSGRSHTIIHDQATVPIEFLAQLDLKNQKLAPEPVYLRSADAKPQAGFVLPRAPKLYDGSAPQ